MIPSHLGQYQNTSGKTGEQSRQTWEMLQKGLKKTMLTHEAMPRIVPRPSGWSPAHFWLKTNVTRPHKHSLGAGLLQGLQRAFPNRSFASSVLFARLAEIARVALHLVGSAPSSMPKHLQLSGEDTASDINRAVLCS